jgi:hypothetical protein
MQLYGVKTLVAVKKKLLWGKNIWSWGKWCFWDYYVVAKGLGRFWRRLECLGGDLGFVANGL